MFGPKFELDRFAIGFGQGEAGLRRLLQGIELEVLADFIAVPGIGTANKEGPIFKYHIAVRGVEVQVFSAQFEGHFLLFVTVHRHVHVEAIAQPGSVKFKNAS